MEAHLIEPDRIGAVLGRHRPNRLDSHAHHREGAQEETAAGA
jgi:hypothetical protein